MDMSGINMDTLFQLLSGMGAGLNPDPWVQNINAITQSGYQGKKQANMIQLFGKMLRGEIPEGGKLSMDKDSIKIHMPSNLYSGTAEQQSDQMMSGMGAANAPGGQADTIQKSLIKQLLNPSKGQSLISASDVAGLSTADISNALAGALSVEKFGQQKRTDLVDMIWKLTQAKKAMEGNRLDRVYPVGVPGLAQVTATNPYGVGQVTGGEWAAMPTEQKQYASYINLVTRNNVPTDKVLNFTDFINKFKQTDREKFLRAAMGDKNLMEAAKELAKSGATRITMGEKVETAVATKKALSKLSGQVYFSRPEWTGDIVKQRSTKDNLTRINLADNPQLERSRVDAENIEAKILGGHGKIINREIKDGIMIWTVTWQDGTTETIQYAINE